MISSESPKITNGSNGLNGSATTSSSTCRDGNDYLRILNQERDRLLTTADKLDAELEDLLKADDVSEEVIGHLRATTGKARLLATQKMVQFEGLCHKNLKPPPDDTCPTKLQDLQGFWDMVMLQVDNIDGAFAQADAMRANGWKIVPGSSGDAVPSPTVTDGAKLKTRTIPKTTATPSPASIAAAQKREAQRKQLAELKRQFRLQQQKTDDAFGETIFH